MTLEADVKTRLQTNATLVGLITNILSFQSDLKGRGLAFSTYPNAWTNGILEPTLVIRQIRDQVTLEFGDEDLQLRPTRSVVKMELFDDRSHGFATLESARNQIYITLADRSAGGKRFLYQDVDPTIREVQLDWACSIVETYFARGVRRPVS